MNYKHATPTEFYDCLLFYCRYKLYSKSLFLTKKQQQV